MIYKSLVILPYFGLLLIGLRTALTTAQQLNLDGG